MIMCGILTLQFAGSKTMINGDNKHKGELIVDMIYDYIHIFIDGTDSC